MGLFKSKKKVGLIADIIRCDEPSYLIWKWHPDGTQSGEHKREYAIRCGSQLRVKAGEVAVFVYKQNNGQAPDFIEGPYDQKLTTANLPILSGIIGAFVGGDTPFQAEVYFINLAEIIQTKFAVPFFDVCDPRFPDFAVPVAVHGTISFKIDDYREFIKLHRLQGFCLEDFQKQIRDAVSRYVKDVVANAPAVHNIPVVQIEAKISMINDEIEYILSDRLKENFGVAVSGIDIGEIIIDQSSNGYRELMAITKDITTATVQGQAAANIENYAETLRIQREEGQYAAHKQTQSSNLAAYQIEKQAEVGVAGAEALGKMGEKGAGSVHLGNSVGFNPAAMMASMAVGGTVAQNISATMNNAMNGNSGVATPLPVPKTLYYVAINGQSNGPHTLDRILQMITDGEIARSTLLWRNGMSEWQAAETFEELRQYFPPDIPAEN